MGPEASTVRVVGSYNQVYWTEEDAAKPGVTTAFMVYVYESWHRVDRNRDIYVAAWLPDVGRWVTTYEPVPPDYLGPIGEQILRLIDEFLGG